VGIPRAAEDPRPRPPAHLLAVANLKGGTGKSTLAVSLACALAAGGTGRVVLVDNDEQGTAAAWGAGGRLPARCLHLPLRRIGELGPWIGTLNALRTRHDVVVVDFPAGIAPALAACLLAASLVLVPTSPGGLDLAATRQMLRHISRARAARPGAPPRVLVVPNRLPGGGRLDAALRDRLGSLGEELAPPLGDHPEHADAYAARRWIGAQGPGSAAHREVEALARRVRELLAGATPRTWPQA
jgi:chromosome partitioning protein